MDKCLTVILFWYRKDGVYAWPDFSCHSEQEGVVRLIGFSVEIRESWSRAEPRLPFDDRAYKGNLQ